MLTYPADLTDSPRWRGERNNNPLNMDYNHIPWDGLADPKDWAGEPRFAVFQDPEHGIRAAVVNMRTHFSRDPQLSLGGLVAIWAPPNENDTTAYLAHVVLLTKIPVTHIVDLHDTVFVTTLVKALITHECGRCIYPDTLIARALQLLGDWRAALAVSSLG